MADDGGQGELFDNGLAMRRAVLGAEYVDRSIANADAFTRPFQKLVTEWCWGEVWNRPGLDKKMRSIINLAMLTALNRPNEVRLHVRGALNNGVTREEIQEVLLHTTVYCGAALESFRIAAEVLKEEDAKKR
jgi:4-carboxymuconolactone decarboxylase